MPKRASGRSREAPESRVGERQRKTRAARKNPPAASRESKVAARKRRDGATQARRPKKTPSLRAAAPPQDLDARLAFFARARRYAPYLGIEVDGARFVVSTDDQELGRGMFGKRGRPEFKVLGRAVTVIQILAGEDAVAGSLFVDVGANIGTTTVAALLSHRFGAAVCFEPETENYRLLLANLALNGLEDDVRSLRVGVSNRTGRSLLVVGEGGGSMHWIAEDLEMVRSAERTQAVRAAEQPELRVRKMVPVEVELVTLDGLVESGVIDKNRVGMVWIDAEGHEGHVLQGGAGLLQDGVPVVLEFHPAGLQEHGDRDQIHAIAEDAYTHFVDVRRQEVAGPRFQLHPVERLAAYADRRLATTGEGFFTDLLLLRLDEAQARKGSDLPRLVAARLGTGPTEG